MRKILSLLMMMFASIALVFADEPVQIASGTFNGKNATYTEGWITTGTGVSRTDCIIIGADESITSPEVDLSQYESISVAIKARRFGTLSGSKAEIAVTFDGEAIGNTVASGTSATTALDVINYTVSDLSTGNFVVTCTNATSAGSTHGAGINSIVITGVLKSQQGGGGETPAHTYTVAGSSTDLFGTAWTPSEEANDMTLVEGLYTWEKTDLTLAAGNIEFKVCEDHAWTTAYPAQNYQLNIPEAGIYTVTITFNAETKEVAAVATKTGSAVVVPTVAMHGNFLGGWADTENFTIAEGNATASLTLNIEAGDYEFGMRIGGSGNWTANGVSFTRENPSAVIVAGSGNLKLAADKAGEYTFTWTYETNTLAITFPEAGGGGDEGDAIKLTFTYFDKTDGDGSAKLSTVEAIFDAASQKYVSAVNTGTQVYAGRKYKEGNDSIFSNLKLGSSSAAGELKFTLAEPTEVDSIVFRAAMYSATEGGDGFKVNDENYTLSAGKLVFEDKVWKPAGEVSTIDIVQNTANKGRFFLTSITIYPKAGEAPAEPKFYITGDSALLADAAADATLAWNPAAIKSMETSYKLNLKANQAYKLKVTLDGTFDEGKVKGFADLTTTADGLTADGDGNICFSLNTAGEVNVHYDGEFFFLNGDFYVAPAPAKKYYLKNNWAGGDWAWKELEYVEENEDYELIAVFGGNGVNLNTAESDEGATWIAAADIVTFDAAYDPAELGALDTVAFYFDPEAVNQYTGENGLTALIIGKYVKPVDPEEHTYTVAGSSTDLFGTAWTPANEANDMALVEGLYTWEKTELTLAAGIIEFKVCEDHAWTTAYPAQNYQLNIPEAGIYTVTITFNSETKEVAAVATKTGSAVVVPTVAMHGNFLGGWADTENFAIAEGNATASLTLNIEAGDYEFGMRIGGSGNWTANGVSFTRENPSAVIVAGSGNLKLAADVVGEYTFTWTYETNTLAITFPNGSGTGVDNAVVDVKAVKVIRDNQILIIKGDKTFNIQGQLVK